MQAGIPFAASFLTDSEIKVEVEKYDQTGKEHIGDLGIFVLQTDNKTLRPVLKGELEDPAGCLESMGYELVPDAYYDGRSREFKSLHDEYTIKPNEQAVFSSRQRVKLTRHMGALHFGRYSRQVSGMVIGAGLIQPGWGLHEPTPIYISVSNLSQAPVTIRPDTRLSRLVFFRVTSPIDHFQITTPEVILNEIKGDIKRQQRSARVRRAWIAARNILGIVITIAVFFAAVFLFPDLHQPPLSQVFGVITAGLIAYFFTRTFRAIRGNPE